MTESLKLLVSFGAEHFQEVMKNGYNHEKSHAFFPGYPMSLMLLQIPFGNRNIEVLAFLFNLLLGAMNALLINYLGQWIFTNEFFALKQENLDASKKFKQQK